MRLEAGRLIDQYRLVEVIGEGGMGVVWKARDTSLDRDVAIKVLPAAVVGDASRLARFEREAKAVASLSHPNIVAIYGFGTVEGTSYAAIELLEGRTLREHIDDGPLPPRKAIEIAQQIAAGLDAAHAKGIVHRDLKPENVVITPAGRARILDFGLASTAEANDDESHADMATRSDLTSPGAVMGTVGYMSPEQARGARADSRSDIFSLGTILYEMLTGLRPFARETAAETLTAILREDPPEVSLLGRPVPALLSRVIRRCLEKAPDERFQSARDLAFALDNATLDSAAGSVQAVSGNVGRRPARWHLTWWLVALVAAAAFGAGWLLRPAPPPAEPARVTQLTFTGADYQPAVSPDGRLIAFTSSRSGVSQIWLRQVVGGNEQPLTDGSDWNPTFAPDGASVAFIRREGSHYSAYRVPIVGGQPRKLMEDVTEVEWSPDGRRLAFLRGAAAAERVSGTALGILDLQSGQERILVQFDGWNLIGLSWEPDGRRIATTKASTQGGAGSWRVVMVDPDTTTTEELEVRNGTFVSAPRWAGPDALVYAKSSTTVTGSQMSNPLVLYDVGTRQERLLLWEANLFPFRGSSNESTRISLLGNDRLVFDTFLQMQTIHEWNPASGTFRPVKEGVSTDRQPVYSPDGSRLLFTSNRSGNVDLFAYEFATDRLFQLTDHPGSDWDGAYTPDGRSLLWSSDRGGNLEIWMAAADGSNPRQVSRDGVAAENPTMTADGEWIVYSSGHPDHPGIFKVRPDGRDTTLLVPGNWVNPEVSPDGCCALFVSSDYSARLQNEVRVVEIASGRMVDFAVTIGVALESPNVTYGRGRWMPGGKAIAYVGLDEQGRTGIWIQDFVPGRDTQTTRRALAGFRDDMIVESFGLSPDGTRVAISTIRQVRSLNQADGLGQLR